MATVACGAASDVPVTDPPTRITYVLGGVMSGPFRLSVDLVTGEVSIADHPKGPFGDRAGIRASDLPVTRHLTASAAALSQIRTWAVAVWAYDASDPGESIFRLRGRVPEMKLIQCQATSDAIGTFEIERGPVKRSFDFSQPCLSPPARQLLNKLLCLSRPDDADCK